MPSNFYMFFIAGLIPMIVGFLYYNPKVVGNAWMKTNGFTEESLKGGNMLVIFGVSYLFSVFIAFFLMGIVVHQGGVFSTLMPEVMEPGSDAHKFAIEFLTEYGDKYRSFGHGAIHGLIFTLFGVFPLVGIMSLFEQRGWKYIFIHTGYWLICLVLMGGLLCVTLTWDMPM